MKSAYELAMERLEKTAPSSKLTDGQKAQIAEIDSLYVSKIAERETFLQSEMVKAQQDPHELDMIKNQLARDIKSLRAECEEKKEKIRQSP